MNKILSFFGYNKSLPPKHDYAYSFSLITFIFVIVYALYYMLFIKSFLLIAISLFFIIELISIFFLLKAKKYVFAKSLLIFAFLVHISILVFCVFPQSLKMNYYFFVIVPISFLVFDISIKEENNGIIISNLLAVILMGLSELFIFSDRHINLSEDAVRHFNSMSAVMSIAALFFAYRAYAKDLAKIHKNLKILANTDALTNISNRRDLFIKGEELFNACSKMNKSFSFLILDIDHFKKINDIYGHLVGDDILIQFSHLIKSNTREYDIFARYGGEEFAIVCKNTGTEDCKQKAHYLRKLVQEHKFEVSKSETTHITTSIGVVTFKDNNYTSFEAMMQDADKALYMAKENGRNRVVTLLEN